MRILVISNMYPSQVDKVYGTFVKVFYDALKLEYNDSMLIAIKGKQNGINKLLQYIIFYLKIIFNLIFNNFDLVYVHTIAHTSPPIRIANLFRKNKLIFNIHGDDLLTTTRLAKVLRNIGFPLLKIAKLIVVPTQYFKEVLLNECPWLKENNIFISPSGGVSNNFFIKSPKVFNKIPVIGYVSRIDSGKGWDYLLKAIAILQANNFELKVFMAGDGKQVDSLKNLISELNLESIVKYGGSLTHKELPSFYHSLDWFIFPTYRSGESLGLVGLEAMASHTPVIGSDIAGLKSYILNGYNGFLITPKDSKALADAISYAIRMPLSKRREMEENAYKTALRYESTEVNQILIGKIRSILS